MSPNSVILKRIVVVALLAGLAAEPLAAATIFVDDSATGANNGRNWTNAYTGLQSALWVAATGDTIWVAAGEHKPTTGTSRIASFRVAAGVSIYGGFAGNEDPATFDLADRDFGRNETILSGDIGVVFSDADNSYHVVVGATGATIDGFTITNGNANGTGTDPSGGGVYCSGASPMIRNCTIRGNLAQQYGGGVYCRYSSSPTIINCTFENNVAASGGGLACGNSSPTITSCSIRGNDAPSGGGVFCTGSSLTITNCVIQSNTGHSGGGIGCEFSSAVVTNCTISSNNAAWGGGVFCYRSSPTVNHCIIADNDSSCDGGGVYCFESSSPIVVNCSISGNNASVCGGGVACGALSSPTVTSCTITGNIAILGGGVYCSDVSSSTIANCTIAGNIAAGSSVSNGGGVFCFSSTTIVNTVVAFNSSGIENASIGAPVLQYNCVYGNREYEYADIVEPTGTEGNISSDPLFLRSPNAGPDGEWGTADDDHGDLHLRITSPCIDGGDNAVVPAGFLTDVDGKPRFVDGNKDGLDVVDMGAYERFVVWADIDDDGDVDMADFNTFHVCFNGPNRPPVYPSCGNTDLDGDGDVDLTDFSRFASCFNGQNRPPTCW